MGTIKLTLIKSLIIESVKNETFLKGQFDKALDQKAITLAYHEQAGDENYHERILSRSLYTSLEELKTHLSDYISTTGYTTADNAIWSVEDGDTIEVNISVSDRFNQGYTQSLALLSSKYIEDSMLFLWWSPINEKQSAFYAQLVERDLAGVKRCFNKTAPASPTVPYTTYLSTPGSAIELEVGEEHTVTYSISEDAIDDIEARVEDTHIVSLGRTEEGFTVKGINRGHTYLTMYSRHNEELTIDLHIYVTEHT